RRLFRSFAELLNDTGYGDELDLVWIAHKHFVEERRARRVIVTIDETRRDGHALRVDRLSTLTREPLDVVVDADCCEASRLDRERLDLRNARIHRVDLRVENHQIRLRPLQGWRQRSRLRERNRRDARDRANEISATLALLHLSSPNV